MADYLEAYAVRFDLAVLTGTPVDRVTKVGDRYLIVAGERSFEASNVVVAMGTYQRPKVPDLAGRLDPGIVQFHSADYRRPEQLEDGGVLLVGAGNSGSEIASEQHPVTTGCGWRGATRDRSPSASSAGSVARSGCGSCCGCSSDGS